MCIRSYHIKATVKETWFEQFLYWPAQAAACSLDLLPQAAYTQVKVYEFFKSYPKLKAADKTGIQQMNISFKLTMEAILSLV